MKYLKYSAKQKQTTPLELEIRLKRVYFRPGNSFKTAVEEKIILCTIKLRAAILNKLIIFYKHTLS